MNRALNTTRGLWVALAAVVALGACDRGPSPEVQAQLDTLQATRDSLQQELAHQTEYVSDLSRRIEAAVGDVEGTGAVSPEVMGDRLATMREELESAEALLTDTHRQMAALRTRAGTLRDSLNTVIAEKDEALAVQRDSIIDLVGSVESLRASVDALTSERDRLLQRLTAIEDRYYTVYYAVGTRDELMERGIIEEEGGARVLLVLWKAGETLVPSRTLDAEQFQAVDLRETSTIDLPSPGTYRVVSRHDTSLTEPMSEDGSFTGEELRIAEPERFWRTSRYLILVADE